MPDSPTTNFSFNNENVKANTPSLGVSHVLARTTDGPFNDPSVVIQSPAQFRKIYGSEIVPDGSISNIEMALSNGSMLRICRVPGNGIAKAVAVAAINTGGVLSIDDEVVVANNVGSTLKLSLTTSDSTTEVINKLDIDIAIRTKGYTEFKNKLAKVFMSDTGYLNINLYSNVLKATDINANNLVETIPVILCKTVTGVAGAARVISGIDFSKLLALLNNNATDNLEFVIKTATYTPGSSNPVTIGNVTELNTFITANTLRFTGGTAIINYGGETTMGSIFTGGSGLLYFFEGGSAGIAPTSQQWIDSLEYLKDYTDAYQLSCSHIDKHLTDANAKLVHIQMKNFVDEAQEVVYYIDIPKYNTDGVPMVYTELIAWVSDMITSIGYTKFVAYFGGGYKYYDNTGVLRNCDNLGTVLALGDNAATQYGPWYHFSGSNRGLVSNSVGPVSPNYGSPTNYSKLNALANSYINMSVIKDVVDNGKQTMLYHNFTSQLIDNSEKFLGITRLNLYLKKTLRPILEATLEEPNTFSTWNTLYYKVKPKLDALLGTAMTEYSWLGDQFATAYKDLTVNNEADVRLGKYKARLTYKDIVAMQIINLDVTIDASAGSVSFYQTTTTSVSQPVL